MSDKVNDIYKRMYKSQLIERRWGSTFNSSCDDYVEHKKINSVLINQDLPFVLSVLDEATAAMELALSLVKCSCSDRYYYTIRCSSCELKQALDKIKK